jgi:hypothetical protein
VRLERETTNTEVRNGAAVNRERRKQKEISVWKPDTGTFIWISWKRRVPYPFARQLRFPQGDSRTIANRFPVVKSQEEEGETR